MANLQASKKDIRKTAKRTLRNRIVRSELKTLAKRVTQCDKNDSAEVKATAQSYISALDKAAKRGIIHPNKVSRHKSHLAAQLAA